MNYILNLSNTSIKIDEDEINKILAGINTGQVVVLKQGVFNPSYFVSIEEDIYQKREDVLPDIFSNIKLLK